MKNPHTTIIKRSVIIDGVHHPLVTITGVLTIGDTSRGDLKAHPVRIEKNVSLTMPSTIWDDLINKNSLDAWDFKVVEWLPAAVVESEPKPLVQGTSVTDSDSRDSTDSGTTSTQTDSGVRHMKDKYTLEEMQALRERPDYSDLERRIQELENERA